MASEREHKDYDQPIKTRYFLVGALLVGVRPSNLSAVRLTIIGSGDAFHSGGMLHSSNLLHHAKGTLMLECGTGALAGIKRMSIDTNLPDAILISHFHGDHFAGLPFLLLEYLFAAPRKKPLTILGPSGVEDRVVEMFNIMYSDLKDHKFTFDINYVDLRPGIEFEAAGFKGRAFEALHPAAPFSLGYRLESEEGNLLFSGDSAWTEEFVEHSRDVDLFLCECCSMETVMDMHTSYADLVANRARLGCKRLLLTHVGSDVRLAESLDIECAVDGMIVDI